jgi:hypothetical protein
MNAAPEQVHLELLGSHVPLAPREMRVVVSRVVAPVVVAHLEVPTDQSDKGRCSCGQ